MIDFHCHLDLYPQPEEVIRECVHRHLDVLSVTTTPSAWQRTNALGSTHDRIRTALGLHPELASERKHELALFDQLLPKARYVGEIGLDGSPDARARWRDQVAVFEHILSSCRAAGGRIMSIHSRRAAGHVLDRLEGCRAAGTPVLHWYSGSNRDLERAVALGCWFSVGPSMVLSAKGQQLVKRIPVERVLTETDGPFATVEGQKALPWDVDVVVSRLADMWNMPRGNADAQLQGNLRRLLEAGAASEQNI